MDTVCFWLESTGRVRRHLRRYVGHQERPPEERRCSVAEHGYHQALGRIEDADAIWGDPNESAGGRKSLKVEDAAEFKGDTRWPVVCACGYKFRDDDEWQVLTDLIYRRADTGEEMTVHDAPPGAMWDAWWLRGARMGSTEYGGPDGRVITVKTPAGAWVIDGPSIDQPAQKWARTGEPPKITVRPSIGISSPIRYHAFLTDGVLQAFPLTAREAEDVATKASRETGIPCSVVQVRTGALVVMDTSVALRHDLMILGAYVDGRRTETV